MVCTTHRWRELDSNFPYAGAVNMVFAPFCVAPDCLFAFCLRRVLRDLESIERGRQREGRIIDVGPDGIDPSPHRSVRHRR
jgi:hypothetical protein